MEVAHSDILPNGYRYEVHKTVTASDVYLWAGLTGERYPAQGTSAFVQQAALGRYVAHNTYITSLIAATASHLAAHIPLPGATLVALKIQFITPVMVGTTLSIVMTVTTWDATEHLYWLDTHATRADGTLAVLGQVGLRPCAAMSVAGPKIAAQIF